MIVKFKGSRQQPIVAMNEHTLPCPPAGQEQVTFGLGW